MEQLSQKYVKFMKKCNWNIPLRFRNITITDNVFETEIYEPLVAALSLRPDRITIDISENNITDDQLKVLAYSLLEYRKIIANEKIMVDLSNNKITKESFDILELLLVNNITINVSYNPINLRNFNERFSDDHIIFNPY
jgi:hypothetical protein